jgi:hypothetical protein
MVEFHSCEDCESLKYTGEFVQDEGAFRGIIYPIHLLVSFSIFDLDFCSLGRGLRYLSSYFANCIVNHV